MVNSMLCDECKFVSKCLAYKKLKPFADDARVDLGVELTFNSCADYMSVYGDDENTDTPDHETDEE